MSTSTSYVSGLASGLDWSGIIDQLYKIEYRRVDLVQKKKTEYEKQLSEWQSFNTRLLSLQAAAKSLQQPDSFNVFSSSLRSNSSASAEDLLSVSTSSTASQGSYSLKVSSLATAQKLSSGRFSDYDKALGSDYAGDIIINGKVVTISETDTLARVRDKINNANAGANPTGVTASIVSYSQNDYRLTLTSNDTGADGISLQNGSSVNLTEVFGWKDSQETLKNSITNGAQSDSFASSTIEIKSLLGLSTTQSGTIWIGGQDVALDLATDSLEEIKNKINNAAIPGVTASVITDTSGSTTRYRLQIEGSQTFEDDQNILQALGVLQTGVSDISGTTSSNTMTTNGVKITASTVLSNIDGYGDWTVGDSITISGRDHNNNIIGDSFDIEATSTVQDLLEAIKGAFEVNGYSVAVSVTSNGTIEIADLETGVSSLSVTLTSNITDGDLDWGEFSPRDTVRKRQITAGQDAVVEVDGIEVTRSSNIINNLIPGVTLNLRNSDPDTTITLNIDLDNAAIKKKISSFVTAYNEVAAYINKQQSYDTDKETTGGILFGDGTLTSIKSDLTSVLVQSVWGVSSEFSILGLIGINLDNTGQLKINDSVLDGFLSTNLNDIKLLFSANGTTSINTLEYISHNRDTQAGEYTVNITQAATKSSLTSDLAVGGTLAFDETLTVTEGDKTAIISLTSDMDITDIINAVNTELATTYTEILAGANTIQEDGLAATSATLWGDIDDGQLVNGDVITFEGTTRNGKSVSGSYTISDINTDSIQGFLYSIEAAFNNGVTASLNSSGQILIQDNYAGHSQLSLTLDYSQTTNGVDIFGSALTSNSGGQEGRYAMDITASNDGSDHLVLSHNRYGSNYAFTIEEDTDTGLWAGSLTTPVAVENGLDVAGTINGQAATGNGQRLTGNKSEANVDGLVIRYTGSDTGDIGEVKLTLGVAELFDRTLFNITDSLEGYVSFKQTSLRGSLNRFETQIEQMETRLDFKMNSMIQQFIAMESAISQMQSMSNWLSAQLNSLYSAYRI